MKGKVSSIYLSEQEWELLDDISRNHKIRTRSEMIRLMINWESENMGFSNVRLEDIERDKKKLLDEVKKLEEQAERVKSVKPLISARELNLGSEYDETIAVLKKCILRGDSEVNIERIANVRVKVYLKDKWLAEEVINKAYADMEKISDKKEMM